MKILTKLKKIHEGKPEEVSEQLSDLKHAKIVIEDLIKMSDELMKLMQSFPESAKHTIILKKHEKKIHEYKKIFNMK